MVHKITTGHKGHLDTKCILSLRYAWVIRVETQELMMSSLKVLSGKTLELADGVNNLY